MKTITSIHNEQLKFISKLLQQAKFRRSQQACVLEGVHLLDAYLDVGYLPKQVFVPQHRLTHPEVQNLINRLPESLVTLVGQGVLNRITQLTQAEDLMTLIDLPVSGCQPVLGDCVVLENVQDAGNIGTILRSVAAAGIKQVILSKGCADVWSTKVLRAAMGAHFMLEIYDRVDLLVWCQKFSGCILATALSENNCFSLYDKRLNLKEMVAWVFGNEGRGVSADLLKYVNATVKVPMLGATESLNVAMAATICLFEQMRQRIHE